jgi:DNA/RNA endonuclease YhcR with UshA esterase domain
VADGNKTLVFALRKGSISPVPSAVIGPDSIQTVTLTDNDTPGPTGPPFTRTIAQIRGANTGNQADSVGRNVRVFGTVYGLNQRLTSAGGGYQMFIRDATGGIGIFKNASVSGITNLNEGDSIKIMGKVEVFRGLSQINPDSMVVLATGRPIKTPAEVNKLNENLEADLVRINGVQLVNPAAWTTGTGASGFTVRVFKGLDTTDVRIDNDCPLYNQPAPTGTFDITGMGSQFVSGNPAPVAPFPASGYQLIPRRVSDLIPVVSIDPLCHCEEDIRVYPNPGRENLLLETRSAREFNFEVFNSLGQVVAEFRKTGVVSGISTTAWQSGIYSIRVKETGKIIRWIKS